jgi:prevent-host-death family protein
MSTQVIPVRELNQHTSAVLKRVRSGEELLVSVSGKIVARLTPISEDEAALRELAANGDVILATLDTPFTRPPKSKDMTIDSTDVVSQLREEGGW